MELTKNQQLVQNMVERAWEDEAFKQSLLEQPQTTIESFTGRKLDLPEGVKIVVRDQTNPAHTYLNIPREFNTDDLGDMELTDEQLEVVAGGEGAFIVSYVVTTIGIALASYAMGQMHHEDDCQ